MEENNYKILVVDDDSEVLAGIVDGLRFRGLQVWPAQTAEEALKLQRAHHFPHVLMDMNLGSAQWNGITLGIALQAVQATVSVMIMTGYPDMEKLLPRVRESRFGYLVKPFRLDQVLIWLDQCQYVNDLYTENQLLKRALLEKDAEIAELQQQLQDQSEDKSTRPRISNLKPIEGQKPNRYLIDSYKKNSR